MVNSEDTPQDTEVTPGRYGSQVMSLRSTDSLKAFAHPLRLRLVYALLDLGRGNVRMIADAVDEPANSVSYHLGILARYGIVVRAEPPAEATAREVWWEMGPEGFDINPRDAEDPLVARAYTDVVRRQQAHAFAERFARLTRVTDPDARVWTPEASLWLTHDEARSLVRAVQDAIEAWDAEHDPRTPRVGDEPGEGRHVYRLSAVVFPDDTGLPLTRETED